MCKVNTSLLAHSSIYTYVCAQECASSDDPFGVPIPISSPNHVSTYFCQYCITCEDLIGLVPKRYASSAVRYCAVGCNHDSLTVVRLCKSIKIILSLLHTNINYVFQLHNIPSACYNQLNYQCKFSVKPVFNWNIWNCITIITWKMRQGQKP